MNGLDGALHVVVSAEKGRVASVRIASPRRNVAAIFVGRTPGEAASLAKNLFSLCPMAQSLAALSAGEAALGVVPDASALRRRALDLLCERLGEMLRASLLDWPGEGAPDPETIAVLRQTLQNLRDLPGSSEPAATHAKLENAAKSLGLRDFARGDGFFGRQWAETVADDKDWKLQPRQADFLRASDDADVALAMKERGFALEPRLAGRCVETGACARQGVHAENLSARIAARYADMASALDAVAMLVDGGSPPEGLLVAENTGAGEGFAAVESARGRLYHAMTLDEAGRIAQYAIVAPTEWSFHPQGPFVQALHGALVGEGEAARLRIARLAFAFDPCIRVGVELRDAAHA
jgi:coenzyme F420-reducing hydrogenase alpha subunit